MFCSNCGVDLKDSDKFCSNCGAAISNRVFVDSKEDRPIAAIVVGVIFGSIGLIWTIVSLYQTIYVDLTDVQKQLYEYFPILSISSYMGNSIGMLLNITVLIGSILTYFNHKNGPKTVKIACYLQIVVTLILTSIILTSIINAPSWETLNPPTKGGLIGGVVGGAIGGLLTVGILLFLFRKKAVGI